MRGKRDAVTACFWVLKNMPRISTLFFFVVPYRDAGCDDDEGEGERQRQKLIPAG
jgi:hypothetical protein